MMRTAFADAVYWIAVANRKDQWHSRAINAMQSLGPARIMTTEEVLGEFLTHYSGQGMTPRDIAARTVEKILANPMVTVLPQSHQSFLDGLALYQARLDKQFSLADCISMVAMRRHGLREVLTNDDHFAQEGFIKLL